MENFLKFADIMVWPITVFFTIWLVSKPFDKIAEAISQIAHTIYFNFVQLKQ